MRIKLVLVVLIFLFGCYPKPPVYQTDYGEECSKHCLYSHTYGSGSSYDKLDECYKSCKKAEEIREKAFERWR